MRCPNCGYRLNRAEQLWMTTHGGKQCPHCWGGLQFLRRPERGHLHRVGAKKTKAARRGDRRLAD